MLRGGENPQLPARRGDIIAPSDANVGDDFSLAKDFEESRDASIAWADIDPPAQARADRVVGDQVHVGAKAGEETGEHGGVVIRIVHAAEQTVLDVYLAAAA